MDISRTSQKTHMDFKDYNVMKNTSTLIFLTIGYVTPPFFIHLGISNVNWVVNISNKYLFGYLVFQLGIFVNVKTLLTK